MKKLILSFISPCGRIGIGGFWWRQVVLAMMLFVGELLYHAGDRLHHGRLFFQSALERVFALDSACVTSFIGFQCGYEAAENLTAPLLLEPVVPVPSQTCSMAMLLLGTLLWIGVSWCSLALIIRRLRDTRLGLWWMPVFLLWWQLVCIPEASEWLFPYLDLNEDQSMVFGLLLFAFMHIIYCLPSCKDRVKTNETIQG